MLLLFLLFHVKLMEGCADDACQALPTCLLYEACLGPTSCLQVGTLVHQISTAAVRNADDKSASPAVEFMREAHLPVLRRLFELGSADVPDQTLADALHCLLTAMMPAGSDGNMSALYLDKATLEGDTAFDDQPVARLLFATAAAAHCNADCNAALAVRMADAVKAAKLDAAKPSRLLMPIVDVAHKVCLSKAAPGNGALGCICREALCTTVWKSSSEGEKHDVLVQKLLALLRSETGCIRVRLGDDTAEWGTMRDLCNSTTEAQLNNSAAISLSHVNKEGNAECTAGRVQVLQLLRHLPHLKRLNISAERNFIGNQEAAALSDTLRHSTLQVLCFARTARLYAGFLAC